MMPANAGRFEGLQQTALRWSNRLRQAAAVCHGLMLVNKTLLVGDDLERDLFRLVEARFVVRHFWALHPLPLCVLYCVT